MRTHRPRVRRALAVVTAAALALVAAVPATVPAAAGGPSCTVTNLTRGGRAGTLAQAVKAARSGDRLEVRGTCLGSTDIDRDLTIVGRRTTATGTPTLDGDYSGHVLRIRRQATVAIAGLTITHGTADGAAWPAQSGGGIYSAGRLTLRRVVVTENFARDSGGGLRLEGPTTLIRTTVSYNVVTTDGDGCGIATSAALTIRGGAVRGNVPGDAACLGAGITAWAGSRVRLLGSARVSENDAGSGGAGGVYVHLGARLAMRDTSRVTGNTTTATGGGIVSCGTLAFAGTEASHVFDNTPDDVVRVTC